MSTDCGIAGNLHPTIEPQDHDDLTNRHHAQIPQLLLTAECGVTYGNFDNRLRRIAARVRGMSNTDPCLALGRGSSRRFWRRCDTQRSLFHQRAAYVQRGKRSKNVLWVVVLCAIQLEYGRLNNCRARGRSNTLFRRVQRNVRDRLQIQSLRGNRYKMLPQRHVGYD